MWPYHPDLLAIPVPRYTSFPTAAEFTEDVRGADLEQALADIEGDISLYIHIPYCETICWYCGCNTGRANRKERLASYLEALHREIALIGARISPYGRVRRVAFGGGSPNAITPTDFARLNLALTQHMPLVDPDFSIELDPRTLDAGWFAALEVVGVRLASLGVQTFEPRLQEAIGRVQPTALIEDAVVRLRKAGVTSLNFDLIYGLPGQQLSDLEATLEQTVALGADRVALFGYAHMPHLLPRQRRIDASALPDQAERFAMAALGHERLIEAGYVAVGFDHFALPGDPLAQAARSGSLHRNFQGFTDDNAAVTIGLGASAISSFPSLLIQNEKNAGRYRMMLSQGAITSARGIRRSPDDQLRANVIEHILCEGRAELPEPLRKEASERLGMFFEKGLIRWEGQSLVLEPCALPYARVIAATFDPYRQKEGNRFSSAV